MPFFSSRKPEDDYVEEQVPVHEEQHRSEKRGFFGGRRDRSPSPASTTRTSTTATSSSRNSVGTSRKGSLLQRSFGHGNGSGGVELDPSIVQARERVMAAEAAEKEADRALEAARVGVRAAREHVKRLELEAQEEARRAKIKAFHAKEVSKRGKQLGRHGA